MLFNVLQIKDDEFPRLIALQFAFKGDKGKPMCSCFLGTSPEFEIAAYSILFFMKPGVHDVQLDEYEVEIACKKLGPKHIGTSYISAARMQSILIAQEKWLRVVAYLVIVQMLAVGLFAVKQILSRRDLYIQVESQPLG